MCSVMEWQRIIITAIIGFSLNCGSTVAKPPHILFIVADDLGWNDVGFHNPYVISPNIDKLAREGVILNQSYVQPLCTPSRNAFMSGVYPYKAGLQHGAFLPQQPACAPLNLTYIPQKLKELGYATHMVGKWHLGFCNWECTPTYRGFDTFYGFYQGQEDYYNYTVMGGNDFRDNEKAIKPKGEYSTVPKVYEDMYKNVKNEGRRKYLGMVTAMDDAIGNITDMLKQKGMYDDTLIVFTSDNGGWPQFFGNNYPLRGSKLTIYEGGTRASAFIHGKMLKKTGYTYDGLIHAVDWMPTILSVAGGKPAIDIDGVDQWQSLLEGSDSKRNEFIYNLDNKFPPFNGHAAIRFGDYKLIEGFPGIYPGWYKPPEEDGETLVGNSDVEFGYFQLFNVKDDPDERKDLSLKERGKLKELLKRLNKYKKQMVPAIFPKNDPDGAPGNYGGFWSPGWC